MRQMLKRLTSIRSILAVSLIAGALATAVVSFSASAPGITPKPDVLIQPKDNPVISERAASIIEKRTTDGRAKVWVYFTDKGFTSQAGMAAAVSRENISLTPRAAARRAKVGRGQLEFLDMPVHQPYIDGVAAAGARVRHPSRWLNAVSVEIESDKLGILAALPFVRKIAPVIGHKYKPVETGPELPSETGSLERPAAPANVALNYGSSLSQLQEINVPAVHQLGYFGQGVLVCMMDTGYRKNHVAFQTAYNEGRVLAEYDFIFDDSNTQDEAEDQPGQHNHGTYTWSTLGGQADGSLYGPAYGSEFILAKTEDIRSETQVEEDNWVAGMEWAESFGASVISSSLVYSDWYVYTDYNGDLCVTTIAADLAATLGILVCNANGNYGPAAGTLGAPADADSILAVGAVNSTGDIAGFSSRGPTPDGRIKPEVCARGVSTVCASPANPAGFTTASGTSLSTPLVGGCAAVLWSAHPLWTPMQVREALMMTASMATTPNNDFGWGIVDLLAAMDYGTDPGYIPGDLNYDAAIDLLDITMQIDIVFYGSPPPYPPGTPDINLDGLISSLDIVFLIDHVFRSGPPPPYPPG